MAEAPVRRAYHMYLLAVMFVTLLAGAGGVAQMGRAVAQEAGNEESLWAVTVGTSFAHYEPVIPETRRTVFMGLGRNELWSEILRTGLVALLAASIFEFHRRRWRELLRNERAHG
jgi:hypothetical protein